MIINFERTEDAYLAVAWAVISADKAGSLQERTFLHDNIKAIDLFKDYSDVQFSDMVGSSYIRAKESFLIESGPLSDEIAESLIKAVKEAVNEDLWLSIYDMACGLACSDELHENEMIFMKHLQSGFGIEDSIAKDILDKYLQQHTS